MRPDVDDVAAGIVCDAAQEGADLVALIPFMVGKVLE
jgi:hypothetical protein